MAQLFKNNAAGAIYGSISDADTTITLATGHGARFPSVGSDYFLATLIGVDGNGAENAWEIVKVTARSNDVLTVVRAQEGTTAAIWASGTRIEARATAATFGSFLVATGVTPGTYSKLTVLASGLISAGAQLASGDITTALGFTPENAANKNVANGYVGLDSNTLIPSVYLPSYVDDVIEASDFASLPGTGETGKIYVLATPYTSGGITSSQFRWSGSAYVAIVASPGTTDAVTEGASNLYFTTARARTSVSATGSLSYDNTTGVFSYTTPSNISTFTNDVGYITSTALNGYITAATVAATYLPLVGGSISGDVTFTGIGARIKGDFSNATVSSRAMFQTSTTNGTTQVGILPNGTSVNAQLHLFGASDPTNAPYGGLVINSTAIRVLSAALGSGTALPLTFYMGSTEYGRLSTGGNWLLGTTTDDGVNKLQVSGTVSATRHTTPATAGTTPTYGSDLLAGIGAFTDATGWTLGSGWSITGGQAVYTSGGGTLSATIAVVSGTKYQIDWTHVSGSYTITATIGAVSISSGVDSTVRSLTLTAGATGSLTLSIAMSAAATIDALTVKAITTYGRVSAYSALDAGGSVGAEVALFTRTAYNAAVGTSTLSNITTGVENMAFGATALNACTVGINNVGIGASALALLSVGGNNVAVGRSALYAATSAESNVGIGASALTSVTTGYRNAATGKGALLNVTTGYYNVGVGYYAGVGITTGTGNTIIGANVTGLAAGLTNNIILASGGGNIKAQHDGSNWTFTGGINLDKTITAGGTTGAQTINKTTGTVNFAAAATSLVVTNSLVTANSIIICTVGTNDTTMKSVAAVATSGSFTLYPDAAPTAETRVNFLVTN